jgi:hypothetical protein
METEIPTCGGIDIPEHMGPLGHPDDFETNGLYPGDDVEVWIPYEGSYRGRLAAVNESGRPIVVYRGGYDAGGEPVAVSWRVCGWEHVTGLGL